jgi:hypothetical protein
MEKNLLLEDELAFDDEFSEVRLVVGLEVKPMKMRPFKTVEFSEVEHL